MRNRVQEEKDFWNKCAQDPEVDIKYIADVSTEECIEALHPLGGINGPVLDIGCGVGRILSRIFYQGTGIDISEKMLEEARKRDTFPLHTYIQNDGRTIPCEDISFNFAYSMLLFQHLEGLTILGYMKEVERVLTPGGIFRFQYIQGSEQEPFSRHYNGKQIRKWLQIAGLEFVKEDVGLVHPQWSWCTAKKGA